MNDKITQRLSENIGMVCLDQDYEKIESTALHVLTDLVKEFALEISKEIKYNAELAGRSEPNMIDTLNASYDYGYNKQV
jgi:histone H3/H4